MTLKFKRNLPLVLTLIGILAMLVVTIGNQPIISYTVSANTLQTAQLAITQNVSSDAVQLTSWLSTGATSTDAISGANAVIVQP
jgi:hypothetical protein